MLGRREFIKGAAAAMAAGGLRLNPLEASNKHDWYVAKIDPGHYGIIAIGMSTSYNIEPIFETGMVYTYENMELEPDVEVEVEVEVEFYSQPEESAITRLKFLGHKVEWGEWTPKVYPTTRSYYEAINMIIKDQEGKRVPFNQLSMDDPTNLYDIYVKIKENTGASCEVTFRKQQIEKRSIDRKIFT